MIDPKDVEYPQEDRLAELECQQCRKRILTHPREQRPDGPFVCDACLRETITRETRRDWAYDVRGFTEVVVVSGDPTRKGGA